MFSPVINKDGRFKYFSMFGIFVVLYIILTFFFLTIKPVLVLYFILLFPIAPILLFVLIDKTEFAFLIYISLMPLLQHFSILNVSAGNFLITPDIVIHLLILIVVINKFIFSYKPESKRRLNLYDKLLLLFFLLSIFSLISASAYPTDQAKRILLYYTGIFQPISFYFIALYLLSHYESYLDKFILSLLLVPLFSTIVAVLELKSIGLNLVGIYFARTHIGFGFHNTNLFGLETALLFPIFFFALSSNIFRNYKLLIWLSFILLTILSALTLNRGTFIVIIVYLIIFAFKKENRKIVLGFFLLSIPLIYKFSNLISIYINRFLGGSAHGSNIALDESALYRLEVWKVGLKAIVNYPLGLGGNGFEMAWRKYGIDPTMFWSSPHQILLHIAIDYGLPALVIFIFMYYKFFRAAVSLQNLKFNDYSNLFFYIKISLVGYLIHGFLTGGELSHLSGAILPTNGYTYLLMALLAIISYCYKDYARNS